MKPEESDGEQSELTLQSDLVSRKSLRIVPLWARHRSSNRQSLTLMSMTSIRPLQTKWRGSASDARNSSEGKATNRDVRTGVGLLSSQDETRLTSQTPPTGSVMAQVES